MQSDKDDQEGLTLNLNQWKCISSVNPSGTASWSSPAIQQTANPSTSTTTTTHQDPPGADPEQYNIPLSIPLSKNGASVHHTNMGKVIYLLVKDFPAPQVDDPFFISTQFWSEI